MFYLIRSLLFLLPAETAHHVTMSFLGFLTSFPLTSWIFSSLYGHDDPALQKTVCGLTFRNPVGLAAGFDKDGKYLRTLSMLGFGFIEVGTVTPLPQSGNPRPRLFRLTKDKALINRMGFNNEGVDALVSRLSSHTDRSFVLGGNIGKNKITPNEEAWKDYLICFEKLYPYVDYFVVNLSSPNTPGLRDLQEKKPLSHLLEVLTTNRAGQKKKLPIFLKISPDLTEDAIKDIVDLVRKWNIEGIIATNTTIDRSGLLTPKDHLDKIGPGGLSGAPLRQKADSILRIIADLAPELPVIGVGGIMTSSDAMAKLDGGADLIQLYTGFVYRGPSLIKAIKKTLLSGPSK